jgi:hypothetical protein
MEAPLPESKPTSKGRSGDAIGVTRTSGVNQQLHQSGRGARKKEYGTDLLC